MKKKINIIYPVILLCVIAFVLILSSKIQNDEKDGETVSKNNETASNTVLEETTYSDEEQAAINEAKKILANGKSNEHLKGKYEDRPHSIMVNSQNITDEYVFFDPVRFVKYEL